MACMRCSLQRRCVTRHGQWPLGKGHWPGRPAHLPPSPWVGPQVLLQMMVQETAMVLAAGAMMMILRMIQQAAARSRQQLQAAAVAAAVVAAVQLRQCQGCTGAATACQGLQECRSMENGPAAANAGLAPCALAMAAAPAAGRLGHLHWSKQWRCSWHSRRTTACQWTT